MDLDEWVLLERYAMKLNGNKGRITSPWNAFLGMILAGSFCGIQLSQAQFRGFGGNGANGQTRQYLNNTQVGDALIEVDPETRSVIVITDDQTNLQSTKFCKTWIVPNLRY